MDSDYLEHYKLLIYGISLLNQSSISEDMVQKAERALHAFVQGFKDLYGEEHLTLNLHFLLHLPEMVRNFGPLYIFSCFEFENLNGILKSFVHSPKKPELQVCAMTSLFLNFDTIKSKFLLDSSNVSIFCKKLDSRTFYRQKHLKINDQMRILGTISENSSSFDKIKELINEYRYEKIYFFDRIILKNIVYETINYCRNLKTNSSYVTHYSSGVEKIGQIIQFLRICNCTSIERTKCSVDCKMYAVIKPVNTHRVFFVNDGVDHVFTMRKFDANQQTNHVLILVPDLECVLYTLELNTNNKYLIRPTNTMETE